MSRHRIPKANRIPQAVLPRPGQEVLIHDPVFAHRRPGRPRLLTEDVLQRFLSSIRAGSSRRDAATYSGISVKSVEDWMARGENRHPAGRPPRPEYVRFARAVREAEVAVKVLVVGNLVARTRVDTGAIALFLGKKYPDEWGNEPADPYAVSPTVVQPTIDQSDQRVQVVVLSGEAVPDLVRQLLEQKRAQLPAPEPQQVEFEERVDGVRHAGLDSLRVEADDRAAADR